MSSCDSILGRQVLGCLGLCVNPYGMLPAAQLYPSLPDALYGSGAQAHMSLVCIPLNNIGKQQL